MSDQTTGSTGRWLKRITQSMSGEPRDLAELIEDLREASIRGLFDGDALVMLEGVLAVADMQVRDIMVPRSQMVFVERDEPPDKLVALVVESGHSRFPVIGEDRDQILGILLAKDLLRLQTAGEIDDEHDVEDDQMIRRESEREFTVRALTPIADFNEYFGTAFSDEEYDTIGGLLMQEFGRLPRRGETIQVGELEFRVLRADRRRIDLLRVITPSAIEPPSVDESTP